VVDVPERNEDASVKEAGVLERSDEAEIIWEEDCVRAEERDADAVSDAVETLRGVDGAFVADCDAIEEAPARADEEA
jgi:hypothetical protein